ncbi:MAG: aldo/keto reductase [Calditrichaeota bacterium]|nr:MAG: aldo/keto reductase [Calditrichota bacterium]
MEQRQLGTNGPWISTIGFGAWAIGGPWAWGWGPQDDRQSIASIQRALDLGISWIDTAPVYGLGKSEQLVGEAIRGHRDEVFIATKCGLVWDQKGRIRNNLRPESIRRECQQSLKRLQVDVIDLYQIHWPDPDTPVEESWGEMVRLREEGLVRYIGVSNFGVDLLERCQRIHPVQSLQPPYSMLHRILYPEVEQKILPWCREHGVGVVAYSPLQNGLLTGKFTRERLNQLPRDDWRRRSEFFQEPFFSRALELVEALQEIARKYGKTVGQLAIAWVLANPAVTSAIVGARRPEQVEENVGGADWSLDPEDLARIDALCQSIFQQDRR